MMATGSRSAAVRPTGGISVSLSCPVTHGPFGKAARRSFPLLARVFPTENLSWFLNTHIRELGLLFAERICPRVRRMLGHDIVVNT